MSITEAKQFVGKVCCVRWTDRAGLEISVVSRVHDATFVPLYGGYLVTDADDVRLDKIVSVHVLAEDGVTLPAEPEVFDLPLAA